MNKDYIFYKKFSTYISFKKSIAKKLKSRSDKYIVSKHNKGFIVGTPQQIIKFKKFLNSSLFWCMTIISVGAYAFQMVMKKREEIKKQAIQLGNLEPSMLSKQP